jgi:hypothetical protein
VAEQTRHEGFHAEGQKSKLPLSRKKNRDEVDRPRSEQGTGEKEKRVDDGSCDGLGQADHLKGECQGEQNGQAGDEKGLIFSRCIHCEPQRLRMHPAEGSRFKVES